MGRDESGTNRTAKKLIKLNMIKLKVFPKLNNIGLGLVVNQKGVKKINKGSKISNPVEIIIKF